MCDVSAPPCATTCYACASPDSSPPLVLAKDALAPSWCTFPGGILNEALRRQRARDDQCLNRCAAAAMPPVDRPSKRLKADRASDPREAQRAAVAALVEAAAVPYQTAAEKMADLIDSTAAPPRGPAAKTPPRPAPPRVIFLFLIRDTGSSKDGVWRSPAFGF